MQNDAKVYRLALDKPEIENLVLFGPYMALVEAQTMRDKMQAMPECLFPVVVVNTATHAFLTDNVRGF